MTVVDCITCLVTNVTTSVGFRDDHGIVHRVRWRTHGGPYRLCDFIGENVVRDGAKAIRLDVCLLIDIEEP